MGRPEEYTALEREDVRKAFRRAYDDIEIAQEVLRDKDPENPLLGLVRLRTDRESLNFSTSFKPIVMEHSDFPESTNWYYALGVYMDLLVNERKKPVFSN